MTGSFFSPNQRFLVNQPLRRATRATLAMKQNIRIPPRAPPMTGPVGKAFFGVFAGVGVDVGVSDVMGGKTAVVRVVGWLGTFWVSEGGVFDVELEESDVTTACLDNCGELVGFVEMATSLLPVVTI